MKLVHSIYREEKPKKQKCMSEQERRATVRMERYYARLYRKAIEDNKDILAEIHKYEPGWMPEMY